VAKFIDHHEMSDVAPEMATAIGERIKAGEATSTASRA